MPASSTSSDAYQWRDSWPPAQLHLQHAGADHKDDLAHDDNPMAYFLTPMTPPLLAVEDDDEDDEDFSYGYGFGYSTGMDMDFDAGIEDDAHPAMDIRSVSPSALAENILSGGVAQTVRPPTPPKARASDDDDDDEKAEADDDDESFIFGYTFGQMPIKIANTNNNRRGKTVTRKSGVSSMRLSSSSSHTSSHASSPRSMPDTIPRRRSPRSWRVPSPDVFMIEEEPEDESAAATPASNVLLVPGSYSLVQDAKPTKRVRFVLP